MPKLDRDNIGLIGRHSWVYWSFTGLFTTLALVGYFWWVDHQGKADKEEKDPQSKKSNNDQENAHKMETGSSSHDATPSAGKSTPQRAGRNMDSNV
jgi:cytoskeletal protein RodZ